jgi:hypothetical protein
MKVLGAPCFRSFAGPLMRDVRSRHDGRYLKRQFLETTQRSTADASLPAAVRSMEG